MRTMNMIDDKTRAEMAKVLGQTNISRKTAQDIALICKNGLTARQALAMRGELNPNKDTVTQLKQKSELWNLANPNMQKLTHDAAAKILQGKPIIGEYEHNNEVKQHVMLPKMSNVVAVMDMVTKRTEPINSGAIAGEHKTYIQVNLNDYSAIPQDDVVETIEHNADV